MSKGGEAAAAKRALLLLLPNGNWRRTDRVEVYVAGTPFQGMSDESLRELVAQGLQFALAATPPSKYPRHRWTGADLAVDSMGLALAVHGLLPRAYLRF